MAGAWAPASGLLLVAASAPPASPRARLAAARQADDELEVMQAATPPWHAPNAAPSSAPINLPAAKRAPPSVRGGMQHSKSQPGSGRTPKIQPQEPQPSSAPLRRTSSGAVLLHGTAYTGSEYLIYASQRRLAGYGTPPPPPHSLPPIADAWDLPGTPMRPTVLRRTRRSGLASCPAGGTACCRVGTGELYFTDVCRSGSDRTAKTVSSY